MLLEVRQRQLLQVREEVVPHVVFDVARRADEDAALQEQEEPSDQADGEQQQAVFGQLRAGDASLKVVNREAEHQRRRQRDGARADDAHQAEEEGAPIPLDIREQAANRRHAFEYNGVESLQMRALVIIAPILCILAIAYRYYSLFIAKHVMRLDDSRVTPAHTKNDGHNYFPTTRWVLFGHHFAAIAGAGPLVGPVFAAQFGYAPGLIWLVGGVCIAGAVQDYIWLWASTRRGGRSLADIARNEVSTTAGITAAIAIFFILIIAMAGLGIVVVNALAESAWATFTIAMTVPLALFMGLYMFKWRQGHVQEATVLGVTVMFLAVVFGKNVAESSYAHFFLLTKHQITIGMALYTVAASVLPVWMLLTPRAYLSTFMKIGTIAFLVLGVMILNPKLEAPAFSSFIGGGGPVVPGPLFPFVFITIACGAISGFHALVSTGTTSKMVDRESDMRSIGYGAMLVEGLVGVVAIITACALHPNDYYAINTSPEVFAKLGIPVVNLPQLQSAVGETVAGRPGCRASRT